MLTNQTQFSKIINRTTVLRIHHRKVGKMIYRVKPNCKSCNKPYLGESKNGECLYCARKVNPDEQKTIYCQCGKPATHIYETHVGLDGAYKVEIPLCDDCLQQELNFKISL